MKPKDLLENLEKGDRTLEHLQNAGRINQMHETQSMNNAMMQAYNSGQLGYLSSQAFSTQIGGIYRW